MQNSVFGVKPHINSQKNIQISSKATKAELKSMQIGCVRPTKLPPGTGGCVWSATDGTVTAGIHSSSLHTVEQILEGQ